LLTLKSITPKSDLADEGSQLSNGECCSRVLLGLEAQDRGDAQRPQLFDFLAVKQA